VTWEYCATVQRPVDGENIQKKQTNAAYLTKKNIVASLLSICLVGGFAFQLYIVQSEHKQQCQTMSQSVPTVHCTEG
jgi:hypothetical protein